MFKSVVSKVKQEWSSNFFIHDFLETDFGFKFVFRGVRLVRKVEMVIVILVDLNVWILLCVLHLPKIIIEIFVGNKLIVYICELCSLPQIIVKKLLSVRRALIGPLEFVFWVVLNDHVVVRRVYGNSVAVPILIFDLELFIQAVWIDNSYPSISELAFLESHTVYVLTSHHLIIVLLIHKLKSRLVFEILRKELQLSIAYLRLNLRFIYKRPQSFSDFEQWVWN